MTLNEYINGIKEKKIGVIGIGISNIPLIRLLRIYGCDVTACDSRPFEKLGNDALELISLGVKLRLGETYLDNLNFDIIFRTPGLMPFEKHLTDAKAGGCIITSEMEAFFAVCPCRIIAVTGSDGKTTTTTLISELLKASGYTVHVGGNIGHPLLCDAPMMKKDDIAVLELSSFQLHSMKCRPDISVITNISPNHLDKHKDFQDYVDAKKSIFICQQENDMLVLNADDEIVSSFADETYSSVRYFGMENDMRDGVWSHDGGIYNVCGGEETRILDTSDILIPGEHNIKNYIAAYAAVRVFVSPDKLAEVASSFKGVEHRLETVRIKDGVTYINDSIGSSPSRTEAGLRAMKRKPIVILGGYDKKIPFDDFGETVCETAKAAVLTGATAEKIRTAIAAAPSYAKSCAEGFRVVSVPGFEEAVRTASDMSEDGDIVLFSPACASFDAFKNFEERGRCFKKIVSEL